MKNSGAELVSNEKLNNQKEEYMKKIKKIIAEQLDLPLDEIKDKASLLNDLGADSLEKVEIGIRIEKEYGIRISEDEFAEIQTVEDFYQIAQKRAS